MTCHSGGRSQEEWLDMVTNTINGQRKIRKWNTYRESTLYSSFPLPYNLHIIATSNRLLCGKWGNMVVSMSQSHTWGPWHCVQLVSNWSNLVSTGILYCPCCLSAFLAIPDIFSFATILQWFIDRNRISGCQTYFLADSGTHKSVVLLFAHFLEKSAVSKLTS